MMNTYKTTNTAFEKQLSINLSELSNNYPNHWKHLISDVFYLLENYKISNFIDIGCGCGATKKLLSNHFPSLKYKGFDYSENAISIAEKNFGDGFMVRDCFQFEKKDFDQCDIIYMSALGDVLENADVLFDNFLNFGVNFLLLYRVRVTDEDSFFLKEIAYDDVETFAYYHNKKKLIDSIEKNGYTYKININNSNSINILIEKNK